jgi:biotin carboxylase
MTRNVFVIGLDEFNRRQLETVHEAESFRFHSLLHVDEIRYVMDYQVDDLLLKAQQALDDFEGSVDAILTHWDFPPSVLLPMLCKRQGLPSPSLESVLKCEHKYWSRLEQQKAVPECTPQFCKVDPFDEEALKKLDLDFPFWIKPIKAWSSQLGFKVENEADFRRAMRLTREKIMRFGRAFNFFLDRVEMDSEVANVRGTHCIAEELIDGYQAAPEGAARNGKFTFHGIVDMPKTVTGTSFRRIQYPSALPREIQDRMLDASERVMRQIGFDNSCFNIEFYWDEEKDKLWFIEINSRLSQSHSPLFQKVDGMSNHEIGVSIALGEEPHFPRGEGKYDCAAKFMLHKYEDAVVSRAPTEKEIEALRKDFPDTDIFIDAGEGDRLSELPDQDAYSFVLAHVSMGAMDEQELTHKYRELVHRLHFDFSEVADS